MDDPTTVVCESEEYFNSDDVIDVTRLNIAKPGELFIVCLGFYTATTTFVMHFNPPAGGGPQYECHLCS